jgi:hypothetical protein
MIVHASSGRSAKISTIRDPAFQVVSAAMEAVHNPAGRQKR